MDAGTRVMTFTHLETRGLFEEVAGAMRSHGYRRTGEQLRAKFKREKAAFFDSLEDWRGIPPRGYRPPSFSLLRELWEQGGRPGWRLRTSNHPVVVVSSSTDSEAESVKRHTYHLSFIERSVVRLKQMVQRSRGIGQQRRRRQDPQQAPRPSSPMAIVAEVGAYPNTPVITRSSGDDRCQGIFSAPMDCKAEASS
ncbi:UNVERIFIED_CONTAM: hypothetical protein K2H54_050661 [Gekko kuhli]